MRIAITGLLVVLGSTVGAAQAQTTIQTRSEAMTSRALERATTALPLALDDALRQALADNTELAAARKQVDPLRVRPAQARVLGPPMLEGQIWQWPINTLNPTRTEMYMLMVSQDLSGRGKRAAAEAVAETDIHVAEEGVGARAREITKAVTEAYWDLLLARRTIEIHLSSVELLHQLTDIAETRYGAGRGSQQEVLKAVVETTKLHDDLIGFEEEAARAEARLNALMNRPLDAAVGPLRGLEETVVTASVAQLGARALDQRPELRLARADIERARAQQGVARTSAAPDFSIGGGYMLQPNQTDAWLARVSVTWPRAPWSRRAIELRAAEATAAVRSAEAVAVASTTRTQLAVTDAYLRVKAAEERAALVRTTLLPQSRQVLDGSRVAYESDRGDLLTVIESERMLLDAQLAYERALSAWRHAVTDLEDVMGSSLPSTLLARVSESEVR